MQTTFINFRTSLEVHTPSLCTAAQFRLQCAPEKESGEYKAIMECTLLKDVGDWHAGDGFYVWRCAATKTAAEDAAALGMWLLIVPTSLFEPCHVSGCVVCEVHRQCKSAQ
jgi:hypothetical protein